MNRFGKTSFVLALMTCAASAALAAPADDLLNSLRATADVNDFAGVLSPEARQALEQRCQTLRQQKRAQLVVVVLRSLAGGQIDDFTAKLFNLWKVGAAGANNGIMLLVALDDRQARIEVGYGLEPLLPDVLANRILQEQLFPAFRRGDYAAGLLASVDRISTIVQQNAAAPVLRNSGVPLGGVIIYSVFSAPFTFFMALFAGVALRRKQLFGTAVILLFGCGTLLMALFLGMPWIVIALLVLSAVAGVVLGYRARQTQGWDGGRWRQPRNWVPTTTWNTWDWGTSSSSWGGFSGGGGDSWGGFGGGSSGGGGASGSW